MGVSLHQLEWPDFANTGQAAEYGVEADLVRFSVGLEDAKELVAKFEKALKVLNHHTGCD